MPCVADLGKQHLVGTAQLLPSCEVTDGGITFLVAADPDAVVKYVSVSVPRFATPEGITVGSRLGEVLAAGGMQPQAEPGWAFHSKLPSGWAAAFVNGPTMTEQPLPRKAQVRWFFRR